MILPSFHLIFKQCRSSLFRSIVVINQRQQLSKIVQQKKDFKQQENDILIQSFTQKGIEI